MRRLLVPFRTSLLLWSIGWITVSTAQAAKPADAVPDSASVVARWKAPEKSLGKLADYVDAVQPGIGAVIRGGLPEMGQGIGNPDLKGVDTEQDIWAIVFAEPGGAPPTVVFMVTAKDVDDVKDGLASNYEVHVDGKLVIYSTDEEALEEVKKRLGGEGKALLSTIDAASKKLFDASDVSVVVNISQLAEDFSNELEQAEPQLDALIETITANMPEAQRPQMEVAFGIYRDLGKVILHGIKDTKSLTMGVTFTETTIRYEDRLQVEDGSDTAKFFASLPPGDLSLLSKLPPNKAAYFGVKADMSRMMEWSMNLTKGMLKDASAEQLAQIDSATKEMGKLKYEEMAMYLDLAAKAPAMRGGGVTAVTPTTKLREISHKLMKSMSEIETVGVHQKMKLEPNAVKFGGVSADRITLTQEFDDSLDPFGIQKKVHALMFGEDGMKQLHLYQTKHVLQTLGGDAEMQGLVTAMDPTNMSKKDAAMTAARKRFSEKANLLVLVDVPRLMANGFRLAALESAISLDLDALDGLKLEPSFIGYSLSCEATGVRSQLDVPLLQVQNIVKLIPLVGPPQ